MTNLLKKPFYFMRHGETDWNLKRIFMGQTDIALNSTGYKQAYEAIDLISKLPIKYIFCSPLARARKTAEIINTKLQLTIEFSSVLKERFGGIAEGKTKDEMAIVNSKHYFDKKDEFETEHEIESRLLAGLNVILDHFDSVLLVSHSGIFKALLRLCNIAEYNIKNCEIAKLYIQKDGRWGLNLVGEQKDIIL